jgi:hypothetical protein
MVLPQALEFDQTPNRILLQRAEEARQQDMLRRKLEMENREKQFEIMKEINPATLYPKFEKEVVDQTVGGLVNGMAEYIRRNPNASYVDLQNQVNMGLSKVAEWSSRVKTVKDNIDKSVAGADPIFEKGRLRALAIDRALYKTDEFGRKVFRSPEEIDLENDIVTQVQQESPDKIIDPFKGQERASKIVSDADVFTQGKTLEVDTPDGKKTVVQSSKESLPFYLDNQGGRVGVKTGANGYIDENVFNRFYQDPAMKVWIDANAKTLMKKGGVPDTPEGNEFFRRAFITDWLQNNKKGEISEINKTQFAKPSGVTVNVGTGGPGMKDGYIDAWPQVVSAAESKDPFAQMDEQVINKLLEIADGSTFLRSAGVKATPDMLTIKRDNQGAIRMYLKDSEGKTSGQGVLLSAQGVNRRVNESLGKPENTAASESDPTPGGPKKKYNPKTGKYE